MAYFQYRLTVAGIALAISSLVVGLLAARYWYKSSQVPPDPGWSSGDPQDPDDAQRPMEPVDRVQANEDWIVAVLDASQKSADLNKKAAILTAWAVVLGGLSAVVDSLAGWFR